jgi:hypothetical protein
MNEQPEEELLSVESLGWGVPSGGTFVPMGVECAVYQPGGTPGPTAQDVDGGLII